MKKIFFAILSAAALLAACSPMEPGKPEMGPLPDINSVEWSYTPQAEKPWILDFAVTSPGVVGVWDFGANGGVKTGNGVTIEFISKGEYTASLKVYNKGGLSAEAKTITFTVPQDLPFDFAPYIAKLTKGSWIWDMVKTPTWGNGDPNSTAPHWAVGFPGGVDKAQLTDDVMTFNANGTFSIVTGGQVIANEGPINENPSMWGPAGATESEMRPYEMPAGADWKWSLLPPAAGKTTVRLALSGTTGGGPFPLYVIASDYATNAEYEVLTLEDNELYLRKMYSWGGWYMRYTHPTE